MMPHFWAALSKRHGKFMTYFAHLCSATSVTMSQFHHKFVVQTSNPNIRKHASERNLLTSCTAYLCSKNLSKAHPSIQCHQQQAATSILREDSPCWTQCYRINISNSIPTSFFRLHAEIQVVCSDSRYLSPCYTMEIYGTQHRFHLWQLICKTQSGPNKEVIFCHP